MQASLARVTRSVQIILLGLITQIMTYFLKSGPICLMLQIRQYAAARQVCNVVRQFNPVAFFRGR
jgi:hypothetical protein